METPLSKRLSDTRLHLSHGPIDLIVFAEGERDTAFAAAETRFATILEDLVAELPRLRAPLDGQWFAGKTARRMAEAVRPHTVFVTPMAAVAGAVADEMLSAMTSAARLTRAAVNNGGDIALHLVPGQTFSLTMTSLRNHEFGRITIRAKDRIGGIATSGRHGRSHSFGIADSVSVLAANAAIADAAATLIANAVDLPDHPAVTRKPASSLNPDSDLGDRLVTTDVGFLTTHETARAINGGAAVARDMTQQGLIHAAAIFLNDQSEMIGKVCDTGSTRLRSRKAAISAIPS